MQEAVTSCGRFPLCAFCPSISEWQKPQVAMKSWGLVAFEEFGDAMTERILLVRRTKSPKYMGKDEFEKEVIVIVSGFPEEKRGIAQMI